MKPTDVTPVRSIRVQNDNVATIPPRSVVVCTSLEITAATSMQEPETIHHVNQYTGQAGNIAVTGPFPIHPGKRGQAFFDQFIYVAIDQSIQTPLTGEQWGAVPSTWTISRGGMGFFCQGYPSSNGDPTRAMFFKDSKGYSIGKFAGSMSAGSAASPSLASVNTWHPDPSSGSTPKPLIQASAAGLAGIMVTNYDSSWTAQTGFFCEFKREPDGRFTFTSIGCKVS
jgi:hypothetical protein